MSTATRPVPICHVQVYPILSGVQRAMLSVLGQLDRRLFAPTVICREPGPLSDVLADMDIPCLYAPHLQAPLSPWKDALAYRELARHFRKGQFGIVHTHSSKPGVLGRVAARRAGVPNIVHCVQGFAFHESSGRVSKAIYQTVERTVSKYCDQLIFVNHEERRFVEERGWLPAERCHTIYNGIDLVRFSPASRLGLRTEARSRWNLPDDEVVISVVGRLADQKQPLILSEVIEELESRLGPDARWRLLIAGDGPLRGELEAGLEQRGVAHRVTFAGWLDQPELAVFASDMMLQVSLWEGLPLTLLEAASAGLPAVASDIKGNREAITHETGLLVAPKNPAAYARALALLITDPVLRTRLGHGARARAEAEFDETANNAKIVALYRQMIGLPAQPARFVRSAAA
jgi:glycosyltransferase involved in cell wall biosynthesis